MYVTALSVLKLGFLTLILKRGDMVAFQSATLFFWPKPHTYTGHFQFSFLLLHGFKYAEEEV